MLDIPEQLERWIIYKIGLEGIYEIGERGFKKKIEELREALFQLSHLFTHKRTCVKEEFDERFDKAYLAFFSPLSYLKTYCILRETFHFLPVKNSMRILDIGAGQGAGSFAGFEILKEMGKRPEEIVCIDRRTPSYNILEGLNLPHEYKIMDIEDFGIRRMKNFDLILIINSLTEAFGFDTDFLWKKISLIFDQLLSENGILIIIEPALKDSTRCLMRIRDIFFKERPDGSIIAPCILINECPMLKVKTRNEWCHFSIKWKPPRFMEIINRELKREIDLPKFSYLIIFKGKFSFPENYAGAGRVVSNLRVEKGKKRFYLCRDERYICFERLDRDASEKNEMVDEISKGDIVRVDEKSCELKGGNLRIGKETSVEILKKL
jgi:ribosomal protein RSM22 (predicted rRNA methylase)